MKKISLFLFLILITSVQTFAQKKKDAARTNIVLLKGGALFVRLRTSEIKINALKNKGMLKEAEEIRLEQENTNKQIVAAFKKEFKFCRVYFFYSNYSDKIKMGDYRGCLLNVEMQADSSFNGQNYLIGEFDESQTTQMDAFIIKDRNYNPLKKPFPYFVKQTEAVVSTRSYSKVVMVLNEKLVDFYHK